MPRTAKKQNADDSEMHHAVTVTPESVEFTYGPQYSSFYCNNVGFAVNVLDFALTFGETVEASEARAIVERRARITMHPTQAKVLALLLFKNIEAYENANGPIPIPDAAKKLLT